MLVLFVLFVLAGRVWKISQGISSPSFQSCIVPSTMQSFHAFVHSRFFILRAEAALLSWTDCLWLISLSIRISFFVLTQNLSLYFSETECTKMYFLQCCLLSLLFWFLLRIILWNGRWQWLPQALCYSTQSYYNIGTMCLKIKESKESSLYTLVFPWLSYFQS